MPGRRVALSCLLACLSLSASVVKVDITPADPQWRTSLVRLPVRFLRVSKEVVICAAPLELFCEVAMQVRNASPFPFTDRADGDLTDGTCVPAKSDPVAPAHNPGVQRVTSRRES